MKVWVILSDMELRKIEMNSKQLKNKIQLKENIPQEDYTFFNSTEDERDAKASIGIEFKLQNREYSVYNSDSSY